LAKLKSCFALDTFFICLKVKKAPPTGTDNILALIKTEPTEIDWFHFVLIRLVEWAASSIFRRFVSAHYKRASSSERFMYL
jgi:hypothetical protein